jgi:hypothetical protein
MSASEKCLDLPYPLHLDCRYGSWCIQKASKSLSGTWSVVVLLFPKIEQRAGAANPERRSLRGGCYGSKPISRSDYCSSFVSPKIPDWSAPLEYPKDLTIRDGYGSCCNRKSQRAFASWTILDVETSQMIESHPRTHGKALEQNRQSLSDKFDKN